MDVPLLHASFDLSPYDGFIDPDLYERLEEQAHAMAAAAAAAAKAAAAPGVCERLDCAPVRSNI